MERWRPRLGVSLGHVWQLNRGFRAAEIRNRALLACPGRLLHLSRRRLHRADRLHCDTSQTGRARMVRHRQPRAPFSGTDRCGAAGRIAPGGMGSFPLAGASHARRRQSACGRAAAAARTLAQAPGPTLARARVPAILRSGGPISIGSTASTPASAAGAARTPICWFACCIAGWRRKDGRFATGVIHLWHRQADRAQLAANDARLDAVLHSDHTRAQRGLSALRAAAEAGENDRENDHHAASAILNQTP